MGSILNPASQEDFLSTLLDNLGALILVVDAQGHILRFNRQCERVSGYSFADIKGTCWWDVLLPADRRETTRQAFAQLQPDQLPRTYELCWITKTGEERLIHCTDTALLDADGQLAYVAITGMTLTDNRAVEKRLRSSEAELRALLAAINDVILVIDSQGRYLEIAPTNPKLLYRPAEVLLGKTFYEVMPKDLADYFLDAVRRTLRANTTQSIEYSLDIDGSTYWFAANMSVMDEDKVVIVARDITGRKQAEAEREALIKELREASRVKDEFLSNISHELRTPLNAIIGMIGIMLMSGSLDERNMRLAQRARVNSERLLMLINDILDISQIEAGRIELVTSEFSVFHLAERLHKEFLLPADQKGLTFSLDVDPSVPDIVKMDENALAKIISNLLSNAIKFTPKGSIWLHFRQQDSALIVEVGDTGIGIPAYLHDMIFESFWQADGSASRSFSGTGLGLAIVRHLTSAMHGAVRVESSPEQGSTFTVTVPLVID